MKMKHDDDVQRQKRECTNRGVVCQVSFSKWIDGKLKILRCYARLYLIDIITIALLEFVALILDYPKLYSKQFFLYRIEEIISRDIYVQDGKKRRDKFCIFDLMEIRVKNLP